MKNLSFESWNREIDSLLVKLGVNDVYSSKRYRGLYISEDKYMPPKYVVKTYVIPHLDLYYYPKLEENEVYKDIIAS